MRTEQCLEMFRDLIQEDVGNRGLRTDPADNLVSATAGDFAAACHSLAGTKVPRVAIFTGFLIPPADPPAGETDGPLGALFLARAFDHLGIGCLIATDPFCIPALAAGLAACRLSPDTLVEVPDRPSDPIATVLFQSSHMIALERVGPSHTAESVARQPGAGPETVERFEREVPPERRDRCHTMRGRDITDSMRPAHLFFDRLVETDMNPTNSPLTRPLPKPVTIGIGDGGNEIGMGKLPWETIRRNIPDGGRIACRVPADHLIVAGVSNWGAYALAAGLYLLRGQEPPPDLFDAECERELLRVMVEAGPLVDGVTAKPSVSVDGLPFERYAEPLTELGELLR